MNRKPTKFTQYNFEHEPSLSPERQKEKQIAAICQRNALADIQRKQMLNAV